MDTAGTLMGLGNYCTTKRACLIPSALTSASLDSAFESRGETDTEPRSVKVWYLGASSSLCVEKYVFTHCANKICSLPGFTQPSP